MTVADLAALAQTELGVPLEALVLLHNGNPLTNPAQTAARGGARPGGGGASSSDDAFENFRQQVLRVPEMRRRLQQLQPELAAVVDDREAFARLMQRIEATQREAARRQEEEAARLASADPFDVEAQRKIEEAIRRENIATSRAAAMEHHPEFFIGVSMLYVPVKVNGFPLKAFVDSGAQSTIMSLDCAKRCDIMHMLDDSYTGVAQGVGTAKILGRIYTAMLQVGSQFLDCNFTIVEACIDLEKNCLRISGEEISFLQEHELPDSDQGAAAAASGDAGSASGADQSSSSSATGANASSSTTPAPPAAAPMTSSAPSSFASSSTAATATAAAPPPATVSGGPAGAPLTSQFPEATIRSLMDLGVSREAALMALEQCGGNSDLAASMLFQF
ncbi:DNA damage-inducible protein 1 [Cladochytrium tenue]|nr:DNA damage-inducible protein 1 [Cladochytrium tenue]